MFLSPSIRDTLAKTQILVIKNLYPKLSIRHIVRIPSHVHGSMLDGGNYFVSFSSTKAPRREINFTT